MDVLKMKQSIAWHMSTDFLTLYLLGEFNFERLMHVLFYRQHSMKGITTVYCEEAFHMMECIDECIVTIRVIKRNRVKYTISLYILLSNSCQLLPKIKLINHSGFQRRRSLEYEIKALFL